jgi:hypothetical protein
MATLAATILTLHGNTPIRRKSSVTKPGWIKATPDYGPGHETLKVFKTFRVSWLLFGTTIAEGKSNQEISAQLFLALNTVKRHAYNIYAKLEVKKRTQAVSKARQLGLIP